MVELYACARPCGPDALEEVIFTQKAVENRGVGLGRTQTNPIFSRLIHIKGVNKKKNYTV